MQPARLLQMLRFAGLVWLNWQALLFQGFGVRRVGDGPRLYLKLATAHATQRVLAPPRAEAALKRRVQPSPLPVLYALGAFATSHITANPTGKQSWTSRPIAQPVAPVPQPLGAALPALAEASPEPNMAMAVGAVALARALLSPCTAVSGASATLATSGVACAALGYVASRGPRAQLSQTIALCAVVSGTGLALAAPSVEALVFAHLSSSVGAAVLPLAQASAMRHIHAASGGGGSQRAIVVASQLGALGAIHGAALRVGAAVARLILAELPRRISLDARLRLLFLIASLVAAAGTAAGWAALRVSPPLPSPTVPHEQQRRSTAVSLAPTRGESLIALAKRVVPPARVPALVSALAVGVGLAHASLQLQLPGLSPPSLASRALLLDCAAHVLGPAAVVLGLLCLTGVDATMWLLFAAGVASCSLASFATAIRNWWPDSSLLSVLHATLLHTVSRAADVTLVTSVALLSPAASGFNLGLFSAAHYLATAAAARLAAAAAGARDGGLGSPVPPPAPKARLARLSPSQERPASTPVQPVSEPGRAGSTLGRVLAKSARAGASRKTRASIGRATPIAA